MRVFIVILNKFVWIDEIDYIDCDIQKPDREWPKHLRYPMIWLSALVLLLGLGCPMVSLSIWIFCRSPEGMTCRGYDNATVSIRFPDGAGWGFQISFAMFCFSQSRWRKISPCRSPPKQLHARNRCEQSWVGHLKLLFQDVSRCVNQPWFLCMLM